MSYVLKSKPYQTFDKFGDGYYTGATYVFQGEYYAVCERDIKKAKKYSSFKRAERATECLHSKIVNYVFEVVEIEGEADA